MTPQTLHLTDPARRAFDAAAARPVRVHLWRAAAQQAPLVLLSHGTGGAAADLAWWARGLQEAGFDVAAVDHHGNNHVDGYLAEGFAWWWERPRDLSFVLDHVEARGPVGACGFSIGGYTAAAVCGARVSANAFRALATGQIEAPPTPEYPGVAEELAARYEESDAEAWVGLAAADHRDSRVRAGFLLCPSLGPMIIAESLAGIDVPVAVRWTAADDVAPPAGNGVRYAELVPGADGGTVGAPTAGHHGFVRPDQDDPHAKADVVAASTSFFARELRG